MNIVEAIQKEVEERIEYIDLKIEESRESVRQWERARSEVMQLRAGIDNTILKFEPEEEEEEEEKE